MPEADDLTVRIMAQVAQAEREAISRRTKEALAVAKARGVKLGKRSDDGLVESLRKTAIAAIQFRSAVSAFRRGCSCRP